MEEFTKLGERFSTLAPLNERFSCRSDGSLVALFQSPNFFTNVYSADVSGDNVFMIPGEVPLSPSRFIFFIVSLQIGMASFGSDPLPIQVFAGRLSTGLLEFSFLPESGWSNQ